MPAIAIVELGQRRLRGSQDGEVLGVCYAALEYCAEPATGRLSPGHIWTVHDDPREARIRRIEHGLTALHLVVKKSWEVMVLGESDTVVLGTIGLNKHLPTCLA